MSPLNKAQNSVSQNGQPPISGTPNLREQLLNNNIKQFYLNRQREDAAPHRTTSPRGWAEPTAPSTSMLDDAIRQSDQYALGRGFPYYSAADTAARIAASPEDKLAYVTARINDFNNPGGGEVDPRIAPAWFGNRDALQNALTSYNAGKERFKKASEIVSQQKQLEQDFLNRPK